MFDLCAQNAHGIRAHHVLAGLAQGAAEVVEMAKDLLGSYPSCTPRYTFEQFKLEYSNVMEQLLTSL